MKTCIVEYNVDKWLQFSKTKIVVNKADSHKHHKIVTIIVASSRVRIRSQHMPMILLNSAVKTRCDFVRQKFIIIKQQQRGHKSNVDIVFCIQKHCNDFVIFLAQNVFIKQTQNLSQFRTQPWAKNPQKFELSNPFFLNMNLITKQNQIIYFHSSDP